MEDEDIEINDDSKNENDFPHHHKKLIDEKDKKLIDEENLRVGFYIQWTFAAFIFIWIFLIAINKLYLGTAAIIMLIPIALFSLGFMNSYDIADDDIEENVFSTTFVTMGLIISIPLITYYNKEKENKKLTRLVYLAMILTLFSNLHFWVDKSERHIFRIVRSCFETMAITLYAYTLTDFFL